MYAALIIMLMLATAGGLAYLFKQVAGGH